MNKFLKLLVIVYLISGAFSICFGASTDEINEIKKNRSSLREEKEKEELSDEEKATLNGPNQFNIKTKSDADESEIIVD